MSCPGLVSLTGGRSVTQGRLPLFNGITGGNDGDADMSGFMWSICLFHNTSSLHLYHIRGWATSFHDHTFFLHLILGVIS